MPSETSAGLVDDDGDCLALVDARVDAEFSAGRECDEGDFADFSAGRECDQGGFADFAPRRKLSSASAATHWPDLCVVDALVDDVVAPAGVCCR